MTLDTLQELGFAIDYVVGWEMDNSCGDPDCCGGPYISWETYSNALATLERFGIKYEP